MIEYADTIHIDAPPSAVWDVLVDPDLAPEWMSIVESSRRDGPLAVGAAIHAKAKFLGLTFDVENEITQLEEPTRYGLQGSNPFPTTLLFELRESGGGTEVHASTKVDPGKFFPVPGAILKRQVKKQMQADSQQLKQLVESRA